MGLEDDSFPFGAVTLPGRCELLPLPETNIAPKNGWLEYNPFLLERPIFRGKLAVSFREGVVFGSVDMCQISAMMGNSASI